jgi:aryl-alcohol dehydrogenase-like predicted oxidoreductase
MWRGETPIGWGQVDDAESIRAIRRALDLGITFFDTADVYGGGHSEEVLGRALRGHRHEVIIATKFGNVFDAQRKQAEGASADPAYIRQACEASLRRLGCDAIDVYQLHIGNLEIERVPEVLDTLDALVEDGKVRAYGWSTDDAERAALFAQRAHCTAIQHRLNVMEDSPELLALCERTNVGSINRSALAMGLLTGKFRPETTLPADDVRGTRAPGWMQYFADGKPRPEYLRRVEALRSILTSEGRTLVQGALAWLWARSPQTVPIPGFKTVAQVEENCAAMDRGPLTAEQMQAVDQLLGR